MEIVLGSCIRVNWKRFPVSGTYLNFVWDWSLQLMTHHNSPSQDTHFVWDWYLQLMIHHNSPSHDTHFVWYWSLQLMIHHNSPSQDTHFVWYWSLQLMIHHDSPSQDTHFVWYWYLQLMTWGFITSLYLIITRIHIYCWSCLQKSKCSTVISITNENSIKFGLCWSSYSSVVRLFWSEIITVIITMLVTKDQAKKWLKSNLRVDKFICNLMPPRLISVINYLKWPGCLSKSHMKHDRIKTTRHRIRQESTLWNNYRSQAALNWVAQPLFLQWYMRERWVFSDVRMWILDSG